MTLFTVPACNPQLAPPTDIDVPFEGVEKRLVVHFKPSCALRPYDFDKEEWQSILDHAHCEIVSVRELEDTKVYLLSESTLTVWPSGFLLKTCGRTTPFLVLEVLAKYVLSEALVDVIDWLLYSRLDFLHPQFQVWPHQTHQQETDYIQRLIPGVEPFALPAGEHSLVGFVYSVSPPKALVELKEALMMQIDRHCVRTFAGFDTLEEQRLLDDGSALFGFLRPSIGGDRKELDEFWFTPFGYSCNALATTSPRATYFSCHVSPEAETSYASLEVGGFGDNSLIPIDKLVPAFKAQFVHVTRVCVRAKPVRDLENQLKETSEYISVGYAVRQASSVTIGHIAVHHVLLERAPNNLKYLSLADVPNLSEHKLSRRVDQLTNAQTTASGDELSDKVTSQD